ncbi:MAG: ABC transporter ATP-binding protein [Marinoscillum sp.]
MLEISHLSYAYGSKKPLFDQLKLSLPSGNIYGLLGKNGAGKSTLLKIISGLLFPKSGEINVIGHIPEERDPAFLREVYLITEEFDLPDMTISQFLKFYSPFYPRFNQVAMAGYLKEFKLESTDALNSLSYGQKKKLLLSFGLATDCKLLILDEPTNGLDIPSKSQFRKVVANAIHEDRTFIISTHQVRDMENLIDPVIILDEGEVVFNESYECITEKLAVSKSVTAPSEEGLVYAEAIFGSYTVVRENDGSLETSMNLETLFNTVVNSKERIYQIFKKS